MLSSRRDAGGHVRIGISERTDIARQRLQLTSAAEDDSQLGRHRTRQCGDHLVQAALSIGGDEEGALSSMGDGLELTPSALPVNGVEAGDGEIDEAEPAPGAREANT